MGKAENGAADSATRAVALLFAAEKRKRLVQEERVRAYAEVLCLYAHRLAIAEGENTTSAIRRARELVQERINERVDPLDL